MKHHIDTCQSRLYYGLNVLLWVYYIKCRAFVARLPSIVRNYANGKYKGGILMIHTIHEG